MSYLVSEKVVQTAVMTDGHLVFVMLCYLVLDSVSDLVFEKDVQTAVRTDDCSAYAMVFG